MSVHIMPVMSAYSRNIICPGLGGWPLLTAHFWSLAVEEQSAYCGCTGSRGVGGTKAVGGRSSHVPIGHSGGDERCGKLLRMATINRRITASIKGDFVVFMIGARFN